MTCWYHFLSMLIQPRVARLLCCGSDSIEPFEPPMLEVYPSCEVLGCKEMPSPFHLSAPVSSSPAPEAPRLTFKMIISQVKRLNEHSGPVLPVVVGCQVWYMRWACQIVTIPTTRARIPKTIFVIVPPPPPKEVGCRTRLGTMDGFCLCRTDIFSDGRVALSRSQVRLD